MKTENIKYNAWTIWAIMLLELIYINFSQVNCQEYHISLSFLKLPFHEHFESTEMSPSQAHVDRKGGKHKHVYDIADFPIPD